MAAFSEHVSSPAWRSQTRAWVLGALEGLGLTATGPLEPARLRPWSVQLTVPTDGGLVWVKQGAPAFAFEAGLQAEMAALVPGSVQEPLAVDAARGLMLTLDHGPSLGETAQPTTDDWAALLAGVAGTQRALLPYADRLLAAGLPDRTPATVPARLERLAVRHPRLARRALRARVAEAVERLVRSGVPLAWNHGDLHPTNAYRVGGRPALFDLGDGSWACALEVLVVPRSTIAETPDVDWRTMLAAYLEVWEPALDVDRAWQDTEVVDAVNRTELWAGCLDHATPAEIEQWGAAEQYHLDRLLTLA